MRFSIFIISFFSFLSVSLSQRGSTTTAGALSLGMGGSGIALTGIDAIYHNQAGLAESGKWNIQLNSERRFSLTELTAISMGGSYSIDKFGTFGLLISSYGFDLFKEQKIGLAYARKLSKQLSLGVQMDMFNTQIESFGSRTLYSFEMGIQVKITDDLMLSAHVFNPTKLELTDESEIPSRFRLGMRYELSDKIYFLAEADKIVDAPLSFKSGISYQLVPELNLRAGFNTNPGIFSLGLAYNLNSNFRIDGAYSYHEVLGITPGVSVKYGKE